MKGQVEAHTWLVISHAHLTRDSIMRGGTWSIHTSLLPCNTIALSQTLSYARPLSRVWAVHRCECSSGQTAAVQTAVVSGSSGIWGAQTPCETSILPFLKSEHTQTTGICEKKKQRKPGAVGFSRLPTQGLSWSWVDFLAPHTGPPTWQLYFALQVGITDGNL